MNRRRKRFSKENVNQQIFGDESEIQFGPKLVFLICDDYTHTHTRVLSRPSSVWLIVNAWRVAGQ